MHIDSLFLYLAHYTGYRQRILRAPVYHLEHSSGFTPETGKDLDEHLDRVAIPQITMDQFDDWVTEMYLTRGAVQFNDEAWGLVAEDLPETVPTGEPAAR